MRVTSARAAREAADAADQAQVVIHVIRSVAGLREAADLFGRIWDSPDVAPMPHDLMRSLDHAGCAAHGAYRDGALVGATVAVFGPPAEASCYSLIAGVDPAVEGRGVGFALKLAQRAWALEAGAAVMRWTYDPLLRRNARFNLARLGARVTEYLVDFYGQVADGVNDPETDRLAVAWDLRAPLPARTRPEPPPGGSGAPAALAVGPGGAPVRADPPAAAPPGFQVRCQVPDDMVALRRADPALARQWRLAAREAIGGAMDRGWRVAGLDGAGWYLLERGEAGR